MNIHVFFDLHHTLIEKKYTYYELTCDTFREHNIENTIDVENANDFDARINRMVSSMPTSYFNNSASDKQWIEVFVNTLCYYGTTGDCAVLVARNIYDRLSEASNWVVFDDVIDALKYLNENNISHGFLSNWDNRMKKLWKNLALLMDEKDALSLFSYEVELYKPNPNLFKEYMQKAKQMYGHIDKFIYVGDDVTTDNGGESLGVELVLVDRNRPNFNLRSVIENKIKG